MKFKTVIFDLDDTLYTDWATCHKAGLDEVGEYGTARLGIAAEDMERAFLDGRVAAFEKLGPIGSAHNRTLYAQIALEMLGINPIPHAKNLHNAYWRGVFRMMQIEPAMPRLLAELREAGIRTAVCTNMMADIQMRKLVELGLDESFHCFVSSEEAGVDKPDPAIFRYVLDKVGGTAEESIMVGDTLAHDIAGAQGIGMASLWINRQGAAMPASTEAPIYEVHSGDEAAEVLREILALR